MSFKLNENHWMVLIEFMENHPSFARGQFSGPSGKMTQRRLWEELSLKLNSLGYGSKSTEKWQKTWADIKYNIKKKSVTNKKDFSITGGGPSGQSKLNCFEERIVSLLGSSFIEGVGSIECGVILKSSVKPCTITTASVVNPFTPEKDLVESTFAEEFTPVTSAANDFPLTSILNYGPSTSAAGLQDSRIGQCSPILKETIASEAQTQAPTSEQRASIIADHPYGRDSAPKKRKRTQEEKDDELYQDTIQELRSIKEGVVNIGENLSQINDTLKEIKNALLKK